MHTADARKHGETEERLYLLDAWRDSPLYSARERAALEWTEALTLVLGASGADPHDRREQRMEPDPSWLPRRPSSRRASGGLKAAMANQDAAAAFDPLRPRLIRIAYRMLGSVADAEDTVQEAFLRWLDADRDAVREPEAFPRRVVTRLCLDQVSRRGAGARPTSGRGCQNPWSRRRRMNSTTSPCR